MARNSVLVLVPRLASVVSILATGIITARYLGPEGKGILSLSALLVGMSFLLADVGLSRALMYHVSKGAMTKATAMSMAAYGTGLLAGFVITVALLLQPIIRPLLFEGMTSYVYVMTLLSLPGVMLSHQWVSVNIAQKKFTAAAALQLATAAAAFLAAVVVLVIAGRGVAEIVTVNAIVLNTLAFSMLVATSVRHGFTWRIPPTAILSTARYGLASYGGSLSNYALLRFDVLILNAVAGNAAVGYYSVAVSLTESLWHIDNAIGRAALPDVVSGARDRAASLVASTGRMMVLIGGALAVLIFVAAPQLVTALFGAEFLPAVAPLRILLPGALFFGLVRLLLQFFQGHLGQPAKSSALLAGSAVTGLLVYLVLIPALGVNGAALGSTIVYGITLVVTLVMFRREAGVRLARTLVPDLVDVRRLFHLLLSPLRRIF